MVAIILTRIAAFCADTGPATLDLIRTHHPSMLPLVDTLAAAPLVGDLAATLHQRAWLLQVGMQLFLLVGFDNKN